ncbi:MAG TPA: hypothetical protein VHZ76_03855 [Gammaproteobacteria bacterium]|nr:hypothetical protein [Gammaproteobacteria bacterium]
MNDNHSMVTLEEHTVQTIEITPTSNSSFIPTDVTTGDTQLVNKTSKSNAQLINKFTS